MIQAGQWIGQYKYDRQDHQKKVGFAYTNFEIEITGVRDNNFSGKVQDDLTTGGTEGIGEVTGKVFEDRIEFIKQMPIMSLLFGKEGKRKTFNKKHPKIYGCFFYI